MANTAAPVGFQPAGLISGGAPAFRLTERKIASGDSNAIYKGDPVQMVQSTATGYITHWTSASNALAGVFWGCKYLSVSQGRIVPSSYWPGSDASGDVVAYVLDNPDATFMVQAGATAIGYAALWQNVAVTIGTGSTLSGLSGAYVTGPTTTNTLPFTVYGFITDPPGANGSDITTGYNNILVTFNNEVWRTGNTAIS